MDINTIEVIYHLMNYVELDVPAILNGRLLQYAIRIKNTKKIFFGMILF